MRETNEQFRRFYNFGKRFRQQTVPARTLGLILFRGSTQLFDAHRVNELSYVDKLGRVIGNHSEKLILSDFGPVAPVDLRTLPKS